MPRNPGGEERRLQAAPTPPPRSRRPGLRAPHSSCRAPRLDRVGGMCALASCRALTERAQVAVGLAHHVPVQSPLRGPQAPPLLRGEVHGHVREAHGRGSPPLARGRIWFLRGEQGRRRRHGECLPQRRARAASGSAGPHVIGNSCPAGPKVSEQQAASPGPTRGLKTELVAGGTHNQDWRTPPQEMAATPQDLGSDAVWSR